MNKAAIFFVGIAITGYAHADDVSESERLLCALNESTVCAQGLPCHTFFPTDVGIPSFLIVDAGERMVLSTSASKLGIRSALKSLSREGGLITAQGREGERVYSLVIDEATGILTASSSTDGYTISTFGSCTDSNVDD